MKEIVLIVHNIRSCHNVGSLLRTAEGFGVKEVILSGYTPYPARKNDPRLPHEAVKIARQITKTALGAEKTVHWSHKADVFETIHDLKKNSFRVVALEQTGQAKPLQHYKAPNKVALIVGREVKGIEKDVLLASDESVEIPMSGHKESFNVAVAAGIALYSLRFG